MYMVFDVFDVFVPAAGTRFLAAFSSDERV